jgi:hypothetical protein
MESAGGCGKESVVCVLGGGHDGMAMGSKAGSSTVYWCDLSKIYGKVDMRRKDGWKDLRKIRRILGLSAAIEGGLRERDGDLSKV